MKQVENRHLTDVWAVLVQGHGRIIAPDFYVAHREANSGLSTLNRTKTILSIYHQQRQLQKQRGMCLNDTYPFCQQPLSGNCHSIFFSKPVLWTATPGCSFFCALSSARRFCSPKGLLLSLHRAGGESKGPFSFAKENGPFGTPRERLRLAVSGLNDFYASGMGMPARGVAALELQDDLPLLLLSAAALLIL